MKNILIPTDFSENSWNAIVYALSFFKEIDCNFYILHVSPFEELMNSESYYQAKADIEVKSGILSVTDQLQLLLIRINKLPQNTKHHFFTIQKSIFFVEAIRKQIEEKKIDYIVMGTKGASGLKEVVVGSNTGDVITKVKCPVLVIPENAKYRVPKEIAFPTDFNMYYKSRVLDAISEILSMNDAALRVLHIAKKERELTDIQKKNKDFLDDFLHELEHSFHFLSNQSIEVAVQSFSESRNIDMITMVAKNLNFFQRILFKPIVEEISYHTEIPFLVLHD